MLKESITELGANPETSEFTARAFYICSGLKCFFNVEENILQFYNAGVVTPDRRIGSITKKCSKQAT
jgi:hypothetical protein